MGKITMNNLAEAVRYFGEGWDELPTIALKDGESNKEVIQATVMMSDVDNEIAFLMENMEKEKRGYCFYPNGATRDQWVREIRFHFIDIDHGDKEEQLKRIKEAPLTPTLVYQGRAGYKVFYRVTEANWDTTSSQSLQESIAFFKNIEQQLVEYFGGDGNVINPANALRLPYVNNYKEWRQGKIYTEEVVSFDANNKYTQQEIVEAFPKQERKHPVRQVEHNGEITKEVSILLDLFTDYLEIQDLKWTDYGDRLSFCCPIHDDLSPSAYMYKKDLRVYCSKGKADGECLVGEGQTLEWIADQLEIEEIKEAWVNYISCREEKYNAITLSSMTSKEVTPIKGSIKTNENEIGEVFHNIETVMSGRGISIDSKTSRIYKEVVNRALDSYSNNLCVPLPPGGGKSTLMKVITNYLLNNNLSEAGVVIVVERIETAKQLAEEFGTYIFQHYGIGIDVPYYKPHTAAYVMESAFTSDLCIKDIKEYHHSLCSGCSEVKTCPIPRKYQIQKEYPIVILSHTRLEMDMDKLKSYEEWIDPKKNTHKRRLLIIDEKPSLIKINSLSESTINDFLFEVDYMSYDIGEDTVNAVRYMLQRVKEQIKLNKDIGILEPIDSNFSFDFKAIWYKKYRGKNVGLLDLIQRLIQSGGRIFKNNQDVLNVYLHHVNKYQFSNYNTILLDGTSSIDLDYRVDNNIDILSVPKDIRTYDKLSFHVAPVSMSKQNLRQTPDLFNRLIATIRELSKDERVFVLCFKSYKSAFIENLSRELKEGRVKINHYGNVKGSNAYADCTTMVVAGIQHKGDPFYISKYEALHDEMANSKTSTINGVRRFQNVGVERVKLNDQFVGLVQDICRTKIRNKDNMDLIKIYIPTKDKIFMNLLYEYFNGCSSNHWDLIETSTPKWFNPLDELFTSLPTGTKISKSTIKEELGLKNEAGKKQFQRMMKDNTFKELLKSNDIVTISSKTFLKVG